VVIIIPQFKKVKINLFSTSPSAGILKLEPICKKSSENGICESFLLEFLFFCPIIGVMKVASAFTADGI